MSETDTAPNGNEASAPNGAQLGVDPRLLEILVCPVTRHPLVFDREAGELVSGKAGLAYPIRNGIPIMLEEEARRFDPQD